MKITERSHVQDPRLGGATPVEPAAPRPAEPDAPGGDRVDLSDAARRLAALALAAPADDPERAARVAELQKAVAEGTYVADPEATARKLLLELASEPRK